MADTTSITATAKRLIREARNRAPSFILLNHCFDVSLEQHTSNVKEREEIRVEARRLLTEEYAK